MFAAGRESIVDIIFLRKIRTTLEACERSILLILIRAQDVRLLRCRAGPPD